MISNVSDIRLVAQLRLRAEIEQISLQIFPSQPAWHETITKESLLKETFGVNFETKYPAPLAHEGCYGRSIGSRVFQYN